MKLNYQNEETTYDVEFKKISKNIVEIIGDFPIQTKGFTLSRKNKDDKWDYYSFTTVYKVLENGVQFSNDGSVYVEPEEPIEPELTEKQKKEKEKLEKDVKMQSEIQSLKNEIQSSDYKIIKCAEYSLLGKELPYDLEELHEERQKIRDKINENELLIEGGNGNE